MFQEGVAAFGAGDLKASALKNADEFLALEPEKASYRDLLNPDQFKRSASRVFILQA
jgi:hypothetical protein